MNTRISRIFFSGLKQANPTGRPVYNGKFLINGQMKTNMEGSVQQLGNLYDIDIPKNAAVFDHASALLNFEFIRFTERKRKNNLSVPQRSGAHHFRIRLGINLPAQQSLVD